MSLFCVVLFLCLWLLLFFVQDVKHQQQQILMCVCWSQDTHPGWVSVCTCSTARCSAAAAACSHFIKRLPRLSVASQGSWARDNELYCLRSSSPTVWHWNNTRPKPGFLTPRGDVSVGHQPLLIFYFMIRFTLQFGFWTPEAKGWRCGGSVESWIWRLSLKQIRDMKLQNKLFIFLHEAVVWFEILNSRVCVCGLKTEMFHLRSYKTQKYRSLTYTAF